MVSFFSRYAAKGKTGKRPGAPYDAKPTKAEGGKGKGPKPVIRVN